MRFQLFITVLWACGTSCAEFTPGHFYTPGDGGRVIEWTSDLEVAGEFWVEGVSSATGGVFNKQGNLVYIARIDSAAHVIEVDYRGNVLNRHPMSVTPLLRGSYIDYDKTTDRYIVADHQNITLLDDDLKVIAISDTTFSRASGVLFASDGTILATDQFEDDVRRFDPMLSTELSAVNYNSDVSGGMSLTASGDILLTQFGRGRVDLLDLVTEEITPLVTGLGHRGVIDALDLQNGTFVITNTQNLLSLYTNDGQHISSAQTNDFLSDGLALFVPAPVPSALILAVGGHAVRRKRRRTHIPPQTSIAE